MDNVQSQVKPQALAANPCVEDGVWTAIPQKAPANSLKLQFKEVDSEEAESIKRRSVMSFHLIGCSGHFGHPIPQSKVAAAMARQIDDPNAFGGSKRAPAPSFCYHLGDIVYKDDDKSDPARNDQQALYNEHFYVPYAGYARSIFAIAGNHDGKDAKIFEKSAIQHFLHNFCNTDRVRSPDDQLNSRPTMIQPYPYWLLKTPLAYVIGLYTNDINGGQLDDPMSQKTPQYAWLVKTLKSIREAKNGRALFLALHYPPFSAAANFKERGDPNLGPTDKPKPLVPLAKILENAYIEADFHPDVVISAHAHHYQRITYTCADGRQIPHLIVGCGGHAPIESLATSCNGIQGIAPMTPSNVVFPNGYNLPPGAHAELAFYNHLDFGFVRITVDRRRKKLTGEFFAAFSEARDPALLPQLQDSFCLDLGKHRLK
jgi:Calcineurin-like phosphoesterase